ncbi:unnamed protein product [Cylicocyclus nassatus]|uniref:Uncharacterized protein n=1 Tax=Cylicocyclus nassatus TaxID=53992 RepID=A0AA36DUB8_CYLNA|nr:unnamed protein product [Cylicocyclus nassatus]
MSQYQLRLCNTECIPCYVYNSYITTSIIQSTRKAGTTILFTHLYPFSKFESHYVIARSAAGAPVFRELSHQFMEIP